MSDALEIAKERIAERKRLRKAPPSTLQKRLDYAPKMHSARACAAAFEPKPEPVANSETLELQPDESMVTAEGREGRILVIDQLERAWRGTKRRAGWLDTELYRIARQVQADIEMGQTFGIMGLDLKVDGNGPDRAADAVLDASRRVSRARANTGYKRAWEALAMFLADAPIRQIENRLHIRNGEAKRGIIIALERIAGAHVYETLKHRTPTWAAREQEMAA